MSVSIIKTLVVEGDGIALDALLFDALDREDMVPATLAVNPGLAALGPILPPGTVVRLPAPSAVEASVGAPVVTLWSE